MLEADISAIENIEKAVAYEFSKPQATLVKTINQPITLSNYNLKENTSQDHKLQDYELAYNTLECLLFPYSKLPKSVLENETVKETIREITQREIKLLEEKMGKDPLPILYSTITGKPIEDKENHFTKNLLDKFYNGNPDSIIDFMEWLEGNIVFSEISKEYKNSLTTIKRWLPLAKKDHKIIEFYQEAFERAGSKIKVIDGAIIPPSYYGIERDVILTENEKGERELIIH